MNSRIPSVLSVFSNRADFSYSPYAGVLSEAIPPIRLIHRSTYNLSKVEPEVFGGIWGQIFTGCCSNNSCIYTTLMI